MLHQTPTFKVTPYNRIRSHQQGLSLIELMVGIAIGLMVVVVAMVALMTSRGITGTVTDATSMQQQASYAFRVIGQQIRQAGSIELSLTPSISTTSTSDTNAAMAPVAFDPPDPTNARPPFVRADHTITGTSTPLSFTAGHQNYTESIISGATTTTSSLLRDCLGQNGALSTGGSLEKTPVISSKFERDTAKNELQCSGAGSSGKQTIIGNVTDMSIRYVEQSPKSTDLKYLTPNLTPNDWSSIYAIEVCLELTGNDAIPTSNATYINCSGIETAYGDRLKMVFKNLYQIRSQGQI